MSQPGLSEIESQNISWSPSEPERGRERSDLRLGELKHCQSGASKLEVRKFSGKLEKEWQEFWDSIESVIDSNNSLSNVDKFSYLIVLLLNPTRSAIAGFALTSENYGAAAELLKKRFGKKTAIQKILVNELLNTRHVFNESDKARLRASMISWRQTIEPFKR